MNCPGCGKATKAVLETRKVQSGAVIRRTRACNCGENFTTYEVSGEVWPTVRKWAVASNLVAQKKRQKRNARNEEIVRRIQSGETGSSLAREYQLSEPMVSVIRKAAGLPPARKPKAAPRSWLQI